MPAVGKVTVKKVDGVTFVSDESGQTYTIPARGDYPKLDIDPRIDLTKPIFEQVKRLQAKDRAAALKKRRRKAKAA